jgi:hypothetical protein
MRDIVFCIECVLCALCDTIIDEAYALIDWIWENIDIMIDGICFGLTILVLYYLVPLTGALLRAALL